MGIKLLASIVVLCYNGLQVTTIPCLQSIVRNTPTKDFELIIVDNASTDGTADYLKQFATQHNNVRLQLNDTNRGYAGGNNDGIRLSSGKFIVLLNNDTLVSADWLTKLLRVLDSNQRLGIVGPVTNSAGNEQRIELKSLNEKNFEKIAKIYTDRQHNVWFETEKLGFFCMAMRREVFEKIGYLDEKFGIGMFEDDDYCVRTKEAGFSLAVVEDCFIFHKGSASFNQLATDDYKKIFETNRTYFQKKHNSEWTLSNIAFSYLAKFQTDLIEHSRKTKELEPEIERVLVRLENYKHLLVQISGVELSHHSSGKQGPSDHPLASKSKWDIRRKIFLRNVIHGTSVERSKYFQSLFTTILGFRQGGNETVMLAAIKEKFDEIRNVAIGKKVVIFPATIDFHYMTQRPQQLALAFANLGYVAIYGTLNYQNDKVNVAEKITKGLYLINELYFPYLERIFIKEQAMYYCMWPNNIKHLPYLPYSYLLYDYMDDLSLLDLEKIDRERDHNALLNAADLVTVSADRLIERLPKQLTKKTLLLNNAVSQEFIDAVRVYQSTAPHSNDQTIIGYYGVIAEWMDFDLLEFLAHEFSDTRILLIGPVAKSVSDRVADLQWRNSNICILPACRQMELIPYLACFDVCIIPFVKSVVTDSVSPVKLFEYFSAGKPVVTSNLRECAKYSLVHVARDPIHFVQLVRDFLANVTKDFECAARNFASQNTWNDRAQQIISRIPQGLRP